MGFGGKLQVNAANNFRLEGSFTYYPSDTGVSFWEASLNGHYLLPVADRITLYPFLGFGYMGVKLDLGFTSRSASYPCINFGGGIDVKLSNNFFLNAQYAHKSFNYSAIAGSFFSVGLGIKF